jgi:hypothetical protein
MTLKGKGEQRLQAGRWRRRKWASGDSVTRRAENAILEFAILWLTERLCSALLC